MSQAQYPQLNGPKSVREQYLGQPARAYRAATQFVINSLAAQVLNIGAIGYDPNGSSFDLTNNRFIPPATGAYWVSGQVLAAGSITTCVSVVTKNGTEIFRLGHDTAGKLSGAKTVVLHSGSDVVYLIPTDYLDVQVTIAGAATMNLAGLGTAACYLSALQVL